ncbi:MAG: CDP-diacylglycerol--glycerol-3-phosphate 3-phosphatidyltransferase [Alphaproteobacteria bacterium]|nr:MAG: CDP-diacylglycerol--glycerol-3-phosphate 3-phosphatidyltransferase [Alphaproteobacteria bacterium]
MAFPNVITVFRILATPIVCALIAYESRNLALILFILACISDFFDGYVARTYKLDSKLGKHLDSFADKFLINSVLISLIQTRTISGINVIPVYFILTRNLSVYFLRYYLNVSQNKNLDSNEFGKLNTCTQMLSISILILQDSNFGDFLLWISSLSTISSLFYYSLIAKQELTKNHHFK